MYINHTKMYTTRHIQQTLALWGVSDSFSLVSVLCLFSHSFVPSASHFPALSFSCLHFVPLDGAHTLLQLYQLLSILKINWFMYTHEYFWLWLYDRIHSTQCSWMRGKESEQEQDAFRAFSYKDKESVSAVCVGQNQSKVIKFIIGEKKTRCKMLFICFWTFQNERIMTRHKSGVHTVLPR